MKTRKARNFNKYNLAYRNFHKKLELNPIYIFFMKCACGNDILFINEGRLEINIESKGFWDIGYDFYHTHGCQNPMCEWSKVKKDE